MSDGKFSKPVSDSQFKQDVLEANGPVLVDFWAEWCGPCRAVGPVIEELAEKYGAQVKVLKMDIDANPETPAQFGVRGIPTILLFEGGKEVDRLVGAHPKAKFVEMLDKRVKG